MKTPQTPANLAIVALADSIANTLARMYAVGEQAQDSATVGEIDGAVGALMHVREQVAGLTAQLDAVLALQVIAVQARAK